MVGKQSRRHVDACPQKDPNEITRTSDDNLHTPLQLPFSYMSPLPSPIVLNVNETSILPGHTTRYIVV